MVMPTPAWGSTYQRQGAARWKASLWDKESGVQGLQVWASLLGLDGRVS